MQSSIDSNIQRSSLAIPLKKTDITSPESKIDQTTYRGLSSKIHKNIVESAKILEKVAVVVGGVVAGSVVGVGVGVAGAVGSGAAGAAGAVGGAVGGGFLADTASNWVNRSNSRSSLPVLSDAGRFITKSIIKLSLVPVGVVVGASAGTIVGTLGGLKKGVSFVTKNVKKHIFKIKSNKNKKTNKEIKQVLLSQPKSYQKTLTSTNGTITSKLINQKYKDVDNVECNLGRITPEMDIAQHSGHAYGTATLSSMMTADIFDPPVETEINKINSYVEEALGNFNTDSLKDSVKDKITSNIGPPSDKINTAIDNIFEKQQSFSVATQGLDSKQKSQLYNKIMMYSRGIAMVKDLKADGDKTIILRNGLLNENKSKEGVVDKDERQMIADEREFATFMNESGGKELGVQYSYRCVNVQVGMTEFGSSKQKLQDDDIQNMEGLIENISISEDKKEQLKDFINQLKEGKTPSEQMDILLKFDRTIDQAVGGKAAKVNHCKSGKDRTGAICQAVSLKNQALDRDKTMEDPELSKNLTEAFSFNATEHCARVMTMDEGKGHAKYSEMDPELQKWCGMDETQMIKKSSEWYGNSLIGSALAAKGQVGYYQGALRGGSNPSEEPLLKNESTTL